MKLLNWTFTAAAIGLLTACGSTPEDKPAPTAKVDKAWCTFDDGKTEAPDFFCDGLVGDFGVTARGSYPKSAAGMNYMVEQASLVARAELARNVRTQVSNMVKNYVGTTGVADQETVDKAASSTSESLTDESLMGTRIVRRMVGPEGEVYVWVAIDEKNLVASAQNAIRTSMANDEAAWQKFQGKMSHDEMAKKITDLRKHNAK